MKVGTRVCIPQLIIVTFGKWIPLHWEVIKPSFLANNPSYLKMMVFPLYKNNHKKEMMPGFPSFLRRWHHFQNDCIISKYDGIILKLWHHFQYDGIIFKYDASFSNMMHHFQI